MSRYKKKYLFSYAVNGVACAEMFWKQMHTGYCIVRIYIYH